MQDFYFALQRESSRVSPARGKLREDDTRPSLAKFQEPYLTLDTFVGHSPLQVHTGRVPQHDQVVPHVLQAPWRRDACALRGFSKRKAM